MKSILLALALVAGGVQAAEETDNNPCDAVENDIQTLECSAYSKAAAEQLLTENFDGLLERIKAQSGSDKAKLTDITAKLHTAQQLWIASRDADCAIAPFPAVVGSRTYAIDLNDCLTSKSDERSEFLESIGQE